MQRMGGGRVLRALVAERFRVDASQQVFSGAEQVRADREMHLVDECGLEVLPDGRDATAQADILPPRGIARPSQRFVDSARDEMEDGAALHLEGRACVMREHEDRSVVRRVVAPPALPGLVAPGATDGTEHVAAENPCADVLETPGSEIIVDAARATLTAMHPLEAACGKDPFVQRQPTDTEWMIETLLRSGAEAIE